MVDEEKMGLLNFSSRRASSSFTLAASSGDSLVDSSMASQNVTNASCSPVFAIEYLRTSTQLGDSSFSKWSRRAQTISAHPAGRFAAQSDLC
jgi:hypothetical protein